MEASLTDLRGVPDVVEPGSCNEILALGGANRLPDSYSARRDRLNMSPSPTERNNKSLGHTLRVEEAGRPGSHFWGSRLLRAHAGDATEPDGGGLTFDRGFHHTPTTHSEARTWSQTWSELAHNHTRGATSEASKSSKYAANRHVQSIDKTPKAGVAGSNPAGGTGQHGSRRSLPQEWERDGGERRAAVRDRLEPARPVHADPERRDEVETIRVATLPTPVPNSRRRRHCVEHGADDGQARRAGRRGAKVHGGQLAVAGAITGSGGPEHQRRNPRVRARTVQRHPCRRRCTSSPRRTERRACVLRAAHGRPCGRRSCHTGARWRWRRR